MDFIFGGWYLRRKTPSFLAINLSLVITSSFFRFNQNEIDILNPCQKCNRLVFLLFKNNDLKKIDFCYFDLFVCNTFGDFEKNSILPVSFEPFE